MTRTTVKKGETGRGGRGNDRVLVVTISYRWQWWKGGELNSSGGDERNLDQTFGFCVTIPLRGERAEV